MTASYPAMIYNAISLADADIARTKSDTNAAKLIPYILVRKGALYLNMYEADLASAEDTERLLREAVNIFSSIGLQRHDGLARYYYAVFLSEQGASRQTDLQAVVAPLYNDPQYKGSTALSFFGSERENRLNQKSRLVTIARMDSKFKTLLLSLGWNERDF